MRHITIAYKCEHRPDGRWAPGFESTQRSALEKKAKAEVDGSRSYSNLTLPIKDER